MCRGATHPSPVASGRGVVVMVVALLPLLGRGPPPPPPAAVTQCPAVCERRWMETTWTATWTQQTGTKHGVQLPMGLPMGLPTWLQMLRMLPRRGELLTGTQRSQRSQQPT